MFLKDGDSACGDKANDMNVVNIEDVDINLPIKWVSEVAEIWTVVNILAFNMLSEDRDFVFNDKANNVGVAEMDDANTILPIKWIHQEINTKSVSDSQNPKS